MALLLKKLYINYRRLFDEVADPRSTDLGLYMMSSPLYPAAIIAFYFYFTYNLGPKIMANREPFKLKTVLIIFNLLQVLLNSYITYEAFIETFFHIDWDCSPLNYSTDPRQLHVMRVYYLYFISKLLDLFDTVFFVLRKRYRQVTFLHVYHHFGMFTMMWVGVKFLTGGHGAFIGLLNGIVHAIMYSYYLLAAFDEKWKSNITFKKTITQIQMVQFLCFIIIYGRLLFKPDCAYPKLCSYFFVPQNAFMLILFADFYRKAYLKKKKVAKVE